jgi:ubiquinol-cytochrome c reductase cytochrome b subunit
LFSTIPFIGGSLVIWVWGGFRVNTYTLGMFYSLHFLIPFVIAAVALFHIVFLHETGSSSKLCSHTNERKIKFFYSFVIKDIANFIFIF